VVLGSGVLGWTSAERHTDRWGAVHLRVYDSIPGEAAPDSTAPVFFEDLTGRIAQDLAAARAGNASSSREDRPGSVNRVVGYDHAPLGVAGTLVATIIAATWDRSSSFSDDPLGPPQPGEQVVLGTGTLFTDTYGDAPVIGVRPADGRAEDWMDRSAMFRCKDHVVRLSLQVPGASAPGAAAAPGTRQAVARDAPAPRTRAPGKRTAAGPRAAARNGIAAQPGKATSL
jgi:hypothetical protein